MGDLQLAIFDDDLAWTAKHPVSRVQWVRADLVYANDYNPNAVAPPEMVKP